jgi:hypothetical protein
VKSELLVIITKFKDILFLPGGSNATKAHYAVYTITVRSISGSYEESTNAGLPPVSAGDFRGEQDRGRDSLELVYQF